MTEETNEIAVLRREMAEMKNTMRRQRRYGIAAVAVVLLGSMAITAQTQNAKNEATFDTLHIRGANGKKAALLTSDKDGGMLILLDKDEKPRVSIVTDEDSGGMIISGRNGKERVILSSDTDGGLLGLNDVAGKPSILMATGKKGSGATFHDRDGKARVVVIGDRDGGGVVVMDAKGNPQASLPDK